MTAPSRPLAFSLLLAVLVLALGVGFATRSTEHRFQGDDLRYIDYAVSLNQYGVFGLGHGAEGTPPPGNANAPLYPMMIAAFMAVDPAFAESLTCVHFNGPEAGCPENFDRFLVFQTGLALVCLVLIYLTAVRFSGRRVDGWLAALLAAGTGLPSEFANAFLTEILVLTEFCALLLFCLNLYKTGQRRWVVAIALTLAMLTLTRPSYLYLAYGFMAFFLGLMAARPRAWRAGLLRAVVLAAVFTLAVAPWALRNKIQFDSFALTSGGYAEAILVQRINYNQMSWPEVGAAMIYWLPDFGDSLGEAIFPAAWTERLGWNDQSYYAQGYNTRIDQLTAELGGRDRILGYLIRNDVLTLKHAAVTLALAIRGMFVAKYWGMAGFLATLVLLIHTIRRGDYSLVVIALPLMFMVGFHAAISVSIPRYNVPLVALYALSMGWAIRKLGHDIHRRVLS